MADFFEIDFLDVEAKSSGDAICVRYELDGRTFIHVVDGGYQSTGESVVKHINQYYGNPTRIDHVVCTHNDGDHAGGLRTVLESYQIDNFWMLRPWMHADELFERFPTINSVEMLRRKLRTAFPNLVALEEIAIRRGITIRDPFQGATIGAFRVMAPTRQRYLDLIVDSEKTPEGAEDAGLMGQVGAAFKKVVQEAAALVRAAWGEEYFPGGETSTENEMSVVQYAMLFNRKVMLTGDTGRAGLREVIDYAKAIGVPLPGIHHFQVPHHGGRHNVNTQLLDELLGPRLQQQPALGTWTAVISSAKADLDHPRNSVVRAMYHRGATVLTTEGNSVRTGQNYPDRGWVKATPVPYPAEQEN